MWRKPSSDSHVSENVGCTLRDRRVWGGAIPVVAPLYSFWHDDAPSLAIRDNGLLSSRGAG